jgi:hypothetical protein
MNSSTSLATSMYCATIPFSKREIRLNTEIKDGGGSEFIIHLPV